MEPSKGCGTRGILLVRATLGALVLALTDRCIVVVIADIALRCGCGCGGGGGDDVVAVAATVTVAVAIAATEHGRDGVCIIAIAIAIAIVGCPGGCIRWQSVVTLTRTAKHSRLTSSPCV